MKVKIWCDEIRQVIKGKNPNDAIAMARLRIKSIYESPSPDPKGD